MIKEGCADSLFFFSLEEKVKVVKILKLLNYLKAQFHYL